MSEGGSYHPLLRGGPGNKRLVVIPAHSVQWVEWRDKKSWLRRRITKRKEEGKGLGTMILYFSGVKKAFICDRETFRVVKGKVETPYSVKGEPIFIHLNS